MSAPIQRSRSVTFSSRPVNLPMRQSRSYAAFATMHKSQSSPYLESMRRLAESPAPAISEAAQKILPVPPAEPKISLINKNIVTLKELITDLEEKIDQKKATAHTYNRIIFWAQLTGAIMAIAAPILAVTLACWWLGALFFGLSFATYIVSSYFSYLHEQGSKEIGSLEEDHRRCNTTLYFLNFQLALESLKKGQESPPDVQEDFDGFRAGIAQSVKECQRDVRYFQETMEYLGLDPSRLLTKFPFTKEDLPIEVNRFRKLIKTKEESVKSVGKLIFCLQVAGLVLSAALPVIGLLASWWIALPVAVLGLATHAISWHFTDRKEKDLREIERYEESNYSRKRAAGASKLLLEHPKLFVTLLEKIGYLQHIQKNGSRTIAALDLATREHQKPTLWAYNLDPGMAHRLSLKELA